MSKKAEVIKNLLNQISTPSKPASAEEQELRDLLQGALLYCQKSDSKEPMTRNLHASGSENPEAAGDGCFSLDDLDIKYSLDDLLDDIDSILDEDTTSETEQQKVYELFERMVLRSRADSWLENYNYDMVYSITQKALNATMKEYLDAMEQGGKAENRYYVAKQDFSQQGFHTEEASGEESAFFDYLNLFDIPARAEERTQEENDRIARADEKALLYAFQGAFGIPEEADLRQIGNIIELIPGQVTASAYVNYNMYFSRLSIIELKYNPFKRRTEFTKTEQMDNAPWVFRFKVNLGLIGVSRSQLPESVANQVNNIDPDSMFSIQQLFLDLNSVRLQDALPIPAVSEDAVSAVNDKFTKVYFQKLRDTADQGTVVFAYVLKPGNGQSDRPYLFKPSDFRFYISPYYENGLENPKKGGLYTLNYILACDGRMLPKELKSFTWNWVDEKDAGAVHGSMAINRQRIYEFAKNQFGEVIRSLSLTPDVEVSLMKDIFRIGFYHTGTSPNFQNNSHIYSSEKSDADGLHMMEAMVSYRCASSISSYQSSEDKAMLECRCDITCYLKVQIAGGSSEGYIFNKTIWYTLTIGIDEYGRLLMVPGVRETDNGTTFSVSTFSKIVTFGMAKDAVQFARSALTDRLDTTKSFTEKDFTQRYNNQAMWVLPGNRTFIFKQPRFSWGTDLTFDISYARPQD